MSLPAIELLAHLFHLRGERGTLFFMQMAGFFGEGAQLIVHHAFLLRGGRQGRDLLAQVFFLGSHLLQALATFGLLMVDGVTTCRGGGQLLAYLAEGGIKLRTALGGFLHLAT